MKLNPKNEHLKKKKKTQTCNDYIYDLSHIESYNQQYAIMNAKNHNHTFM